MSTVAWDGKTLAADRQTTSGNIKQMVHKIQLLRSGDIVAFCGQHSVCLEMLEWYINGRVPEEFPDKQRDEEKSCCFIVLKPNGLLSEYEHCPIPEIIEDPFCAWGSGRELALGAMAMGADAIKAVEVACQFDVNSGMGVESYQPQQKKRGKAMPLKPGKTKAVIEANTQKLIHEGRKPAQAYAIANSVAGTSKPGKKKGE